MFFFLIKGWDFRSILFPTALYGLDVRKEDLIEPPIPLSYYVLKFAFSVLHCYSEL